MILPPRLLVPNELYLNRYKKLGPGTPFHYTTYFNIYIYIMRSIERFIQKRFVLIYIINLKFFFKLLIVKYQFFCLKRPFKRFFFTRFN